ncbi:MAG: ATP-binding protein [Acaryochloris sp. RU_4_1]|nr:ATP-binding protein [Acaryochloris sp. RU_4_1]NJR55738.1 ATP-binding protein [Acaryochloris sp. CRU_2_0]
MALSNRERIDIGLNLLKVGLAPYAEQRFRTYYGKDWVNQIAGHLRDPIDQDSEGKIIWDKYALLKIMDRTWNDIFRGTLGKTERSWLNELLAVRNDWAHDRPFSSDDTYRALDTAERMLTAISDAKNASEIRTIRTDLQRDVYAEQARNRIRYVSKLESTPQAGLKPWRDIVAPHPDVSSGNYQRAEFAADLAQVHRGEASSEYQDPREFYQRTHLTQGLRDLLNNALKRLLRNQGDPVIELQTNFGGGKTHSLLALMHLFENLKIAPSLVGVEELLKALKIETLPPIVNTAIFVGTSLGVDEKSIKPDGTEIRTVWGELAWQLGRQKGYKLLADADQNRTSPGTESVVALLKQCSPALIIIDEWVAYIRNVYNTPFFDANLTFAQVLTEAVKACPNTLLVASLPKTKEEAGGEGGQVALETLKHTFNRIQTSWRPASAEESYEIIRRRLFEPLSSKEFAERDAVIKAYMNIYRQNSDDFPSDTKELSYQYKLESCYPIHPEMFERLYNDWSSLEKFQQTRGVLRLMASVIHSLWEQDDHNLLIMPSTLPIDDRTVMDSLTYYLDDGWKAVIDKDIDGPNALPREIDKSNQTLGRYHASRRVARTIFMGSAPISKGSNPGIEDKKINLGCVQPGETIATFSDAIRRLNGRATYLYEDARRYWYSIQPSVTRLAQDRAQQFEPNTVHAKIIEYLQSEADNRKRAEFAGLHVYTHEGDEIADEKEARLVILGPDYPAIKNADDSPARTIINTILEKRGNQPRLFKNMLVFLAPEQSQLSALEEVTRFAIAWKSISEDTALDLTRNQTTQANSKRKEAEAAVNRLIQNVWTWCLYPSQEPDKAGTKDVEIEALKLTGQYDKETNLAAQVSKKLVDREDLLPEYGCDRLKLDLERFNLWQGRNHIQIQQLWEFFATHPYLPRLKDQYCLFQAIKDEFEGKVLIDGFAYAASHDEATGKYLNLVTNRGESFSVSLTGFIVKPEVAQNQVNVEQQAKATATKGYSSAGQSAAVRPSTREATSSTSYPQATPQPRQINRFFGSVSLDAYRVGKDAGRIAEEIIQHLSEVAGAQVEVKLDIQVQFSNQPTDQVIRTITENCKTLKFDDLSFESD